MAGARTYDDGSSQIPRGLDGAVERVVVIGAGMAGLTAANALHHANVPVVVVEARRRIGGRLHTTDLGGSPVDLGGSWIHNPVGNPMSAWADQVGVERRPANALLTAVGWDPARGRVDHDVIERLSAESWALAATVPEPDAASGAPATVADVIDAYLAHRGGDPVELGWLRSMLRTVFEQDSAAPAESMPAAQPTSSTLEYDGDYVGDMPLGGYVELVRPMASGLDVRLDWVVASVEAGPAGVVVTSSDGQTEVGSHVLVTLPLGVLKSGAVRFAPELPSERRAVIERLGFGQFEKVALRFDRPFWTERGAPHILNLGRGTGPDISVIVGLDGPVGEPVVLGFSCGSNVGLMAEGTAADASARVLEMLAGATAGPVPSPTGTIQTAWGTDPFARGAYAYVAIGSTLDDLDALGRPVSGRVLFAGEATSSARCGFADGALTSGIREAKRLLGRGSVELGVIDPR